MPAGWTAKFSYATFLSGKNWRERKLNPSWMKRIPTPYPIVYKARGGARYVLPFFLCENTIIMTTKILINVEKWRNLRSIVGVKILTLKYKNVITKS